jgi:hypothetical protein
MAMTRITAMKMLLNILVVATVSGATVFAEQAAAPGAKVREISFDPKVPIAARIVNDDREVVLTKYVSPPLAFYDDRTLDETIDEYTELHDTVLVVGGFSSSGRLVDNGTWVRTTVAATIVEFIKSRTLERGSKRVTFWHDDGEVFVKHVRVRAGVYPLFSQKDRYLLFLGRDQEGQLYLSQVFQLGDAGLLGSVRQSNGVAQRLAGPLAGQPEQKILERLRKAARKK